MSTAKPSPSDGLDAQDEARARAFIDANEWVFAASMRNIPHWYVTRWQCRERGLEAEFEWMATLIARAGYVARWGPYVHRYLDVDAFKYWPMGSRGANPTLEELSVLNRAKIEVPDQPRQMSFEVGR